MGYIDRIRQQEELRAIQAAQQQALRQASDIENRQRAHQESYRRAQRLLLSQQYRQESGAGAAMDELAKFLETPIPYQVPYDTGESAGVETKYTSRGSRKSPRLDEYKPKDLDSIIDAVTWDGRILREKKEYTRHITESEYKLLVVESCPDGTIIFNGGRSWFGFNAGGSTISLVEWRVLNKEEVITKALTKAFEHPLVRKVSFIQWVSPGFG